MKNSINLRFVLNILIINLFIIVTFVYSDICNAVTQAPSTWKPVTGFPQYGIIHNSMNPTEQTIALGVNQHGNLNTPAGTGTSLNNTDTLNTNTSSNVCNFGSAIGAVGIAYKYGGCTSSTCPAIRNTSCSKQATKYKAGWYDGTSPGARWEGWGAGAIDLYYKKVYGYAFFGSEDPAKDLRNGTCVDSTSSNDPTFLSNGKCMSSNRIDNKESNLELKSFVVDATSIKSTVWINDSRGDPMLEVTHLYGPTSGVTNQILFQALVTITNISGGTLPEVRYRRVMDWDILNNAEKVNLDHVGVKESSDSQYNPKIYQACDNGGSTNSKNTQDYRGVLDTAIVPNPFLNCSKIIHETNTDFDGINNSDSGNLGSSFNFSFGEMACNESATFYIYYGAASSRSLIKNAFDSVGASIYSLGYQSGVINGDLSAEPNIVYGFGFKGLSGSSVAPVLPSKVASLPAGSSTDKDIWQTYAPPILANGNLYQALFKYQKDKQWIGEIKKYKLDSAGGLPNTASSFASTNLLAKIKNDSRSIWTVGSDPSCKNNVPVNQPSNNNNFTESNASALQYLLFNCSESTDLSSATNIIKFTRGFNVNYEGYGADTDPRYNDKLEPATLGDVYHSEMIFVGQPNAPISSDKTMFGKSEAYYRYINKYSEFVENNKSRSPQIYVGANDGMLHAFDLNLNEVWAFIPPSITPLLRNIIGSIGNRQGGGDGKSNSIFTVDGPIAVKDVYIYDVDAGKTIWKTILIGALGWGGNGYYSLDITNPDHPKHLFSFYNDVQNKVFYYWNQSGVKTTFSYSDACQSFNYSKLGGAWSRPAIMLLPYKDDKGNISNKWVAVFGGGYSGGSSVSTATSASYFGANVFIIDLEPDVNVKTSCLAGNNNVISSTGGHVLKRVDINSESGSTIPNGVPANLTVITGDGTSEAKYAGGIAYFTDLQSSLWKLNLSSEGIQFELSKRFSAKSDYKNDRLGFNQVATTIVSGDKKRLFNYYGTGDQTRLQRRVSTIENMVYGVTDEDFNNLSTIEPQVTNALNLYQDKCAVNNSWYAKLSDLTGFTQNSDFQKIVGRAAVFNNNVLFTSYQPEYSACPKYGVSRLIEISNNCKSSGSGSLIGPGLSTQPTIDNRGNIYIGVSNINPNSPKPTYLTENVAKLKLDASIISNKVKYKSWREKRAY